jgi:hypothetical protein
LLERVAVGPQKALNRERVKEISCYAQKERTGQYVTCCGTSYVHFCGQRENNGHLQKNLK